MPDSVPRLSLAAVMLVLPASLWAQTLEQRLLAEPAAQLAADANASGDARRGAILFYQPFMSCRKCHQPDDDGQQLGPDLTRWDKPASDEELIDAVLQPSATIRKGYESLTVVSPDGTTTVGLIVENGDRIVLRDPARPAKLFEFRRDELEEVVQNQNSLMPQSLVSQLSSRQQFLDLVRYLMTVRDGGPLEARNLKPAAHLYAARPLPEYEQHIDHAGMIADLGPENYQRGQAIYDRLCVNCHGTRDKPGSLPTALSFARGRFKNGSDPFTMYQTLTRGFGMMQPQTWMVPQQKYDVIHYIREAFLQPDNPTQYFAVDPSWLAGLPKGDARGPSPQNLEPWVTMDYGRTLVNTYEVGHDGSNFAYKGIAVRLDRGPGGISRGRHWMIFDHDTLRMAAAWSGTQFIDWQGIQFNGKHAVHPRIVGSVEAENKTAPGWANPSTRGWVDPRQLGRDGRPYGPLPREWGHYQGMFMAGDQTVISYRVGTTDVLERPELLIESPHPVYARHLRLGPRDEPLTLQVAHLDDTARRLPGQLGESVLLGPAEAPSDPSAQQPVKLDGERRVEGRDAAILSRQPYLLAGTSGQTEGLVWETEDGRLRLTIPAGDEPLALTVWFAALSELAQADTVLEAIDATPAPQTDFASLQQGGAERCPERVITRAVIGRDNSPFAVDVLTRPETNPWLAQVRLTGFDFFPDGNSAAVCGWDGDVWKVTGIDSPADADGESLVWQRIATGLFQPLGVRIVNGVVYVTCRDQIVILRDRNGDGETDYYENFNSDHQVTEHYHEFAMGLQTDAAGNFYYAKSARHALPAVVPQHGTLLRVSPDGQHTEILARGFRAANGVCVNPDGSFVVTDQEGHWNPKNRINWVRSGGFYGNMFGYHDVTDPSDSAMEQPLCWITNDFDRSPAELLWVPQNCWGPLAGSLLNLSYGYGKIFVVPHEEVEGQKQGGMCELPLPQFPTGLTRGRFHPTNGHLYTCGMFAWGGNQQQPGGFYRVRATGHPMHLPVQLHATASGVEIVFTDPLSREVAEDPQNYSLTVWDLKRSSEYGSKHYNERHWTVERADLSADGKTVTLIVPQIAPTWGMEIRCFLQTPQGESVERRIHNSIHHLAN